MELGEKLRLARQEAGLSQRQLCGDVITRNMLSQIENGSARPSMDTLRHLAGRLGKPVSYFLEEDAVLSPNQDLMARAKQQYAAGAFREAQQLLQGFRHPDPVLEWQWQYLTAIVALDMARQALSEEKPRYARQLLEGAGHTAQEFPGLERQRLLLMGKLPEVSLPEIVCQLPSLDEELLLRAEAALALRDNARAEALLAAAENRQVPRWNLLQGQVSLLKKKYREAADCLTQAEQEFPALCFPLLEACFRELEDFQKAYEYACKQR